MDLILPFKVGDVIESRSFTVGYRGAWFRCKISDMSIRYGHMECQLEYMDYPGEKKSWTRLYKILPKCRNHKAGQSRAIMVRPPFPQWYCETHIPEHCQKADVVAIVSGLWKVGDLVDWWYTGCFWTGKITELLGDDKFKIVCPEVPMGEGGCYDVDDMDLRPALDWSLENGWSTPLSQENGECWYTARLITQNPDAGSSSSDEDIEQPYDGKEEVQKCLNGAFHTPEKEIQKCLTGASDAPEEMVDSDVKLPANSCCMKIPAHNEEEPQKCINKESGTSMEAIDSKVELAHENSECCINKQADCPSSPMTNSGKSTNIFLTNDQLRTVSFKKHKTSTEPELPHIVGGPMLEQEKVANKIRLAEDLLLSMSSAPQNAPPMPSWKFLENNPSAKHN